MTDDEIMRGFIAAALLMGDPIPAAKQAYDPLYDYCQGYTRQRFGPFGKTLFTYAVDIGYVITDEEKGWCSITDKGKEFFANADIPIAVPVPESSAEDEA